MFLFFNLISNHFGSRLCRCTSISVNSKPMPISLLQIVVKSEPFTSHCCCCWDWDQLVGLVVLLVTVHILQVKNISTFLHCCSELLISCQIENKKWQNRQIFYAVYHYLLPQQRTSNETSPIIKTFLKCMIWCCVKQVQGPHLKLVIFPSQLPGKLHPGAVPAQKHGFVILFVNLDPGWRMTLYQKEKN